MKFSSATNRRRIVLGSASLFALLPALAHAQATTTQVAQNTSPPARTQGGVSSPTTVGEIVVTVQRREQRLKDVPVTVDVTTGAQLQQLGIDSTRELTSTTPGLVMGMKAGAAIQPAIRGVSTSGNGPGVEPNVSLYQDGVYMPSQAANVFDLPDVSRIEVDKGPQGTLFGRNSTGGAIQIFSLDPQFTPSGTVSLGYGSFNEFIASAHATGPIIGDTLAGSLTLYHRSTDGYIKDVLNGHEVAAIESDEVRGKLLWNFGGGSSILLTAWYLNSRDPTGFALQPLNGNTSGRRVDSDVFTPTGPREIAPNADPTSDVIQYGASMVINLKLASGTLTSTTGYQNSTIHDTVDADGSPIFALAFLQNNPDHSVNQEVIYNSAQLGRFRFLLGVFGFWDDAKYAPSAILLPPATALNYFVKNLTDAYAGFGDLTVDITDRLSVTGGLRYSWEQRFYYGSINNTGAFPFIADHSWGAFTPRATINYRTDLANVYFSYSQGFSSGVYAPTGLSKIPANPEYIKAYELGVKSGNSAFTLNASGFFYDYTNLQVTTVVNNVSSFSNAATARIYGLDIDGAWQVTDRFSLRAGLEALHARFTSFPNAVVNVPNTNCPATGAFPCGDVSVAINATGNTLPRAPDFTGDVSAQYKFPLMSGTASLVGTAYYNSGYPWEIGNRVNQPRYALFSFNASWTPASEQFRLSVWGKNLSNATYEQSEFDLSAGDLAVYAPGRSFGGTIAYSF
jgi:iron complex outermembrane receptor protein